MLNHIVLMGRLTRDPELRRTGSGIAVANFSIAVERDFGKEGGNKETDFFDCVAWRQTGEFVSKYFGKGRMIAVSGRLETRSYVDKNGSNRKATEIVAENCYFADSKKEAEAGRNTETGFSVVPAGYQAPVSATAADFAMLDDEDAQLPF